MDSITIPAEIPEKYGISLLLLFGSQASGETHKESDFDIAYLAEKPLTLEDEADLILDLSRIFKKDDIDLVNIRRASPLLLYSITDNPVVIYEQNDIVFPELQAYAFKIYVDSEAISKLQETLLQLK